MDYQGALEISIIDMNGRIVKQFIENDFDGQASLPITELPAAMYLVNIKGTDFQQHEKLIIQ